MQKLSAEEFALLPIKGKGRSSVLFNSLINLKVGEGLLIEAKDWNRKAAPSSLIRYIEKNYQMKFSFGALASGSGWAVQRINEAKKEIIKADKTPEAKPRQQEDHLTLKSELTLFYLGRITLNKIERIEETIKAVFLNFWKIDEKKLKELFYEIIEDLHQKGQIVVENEKTYIPLKGT
jgi:uncharacterized protein (DUF2249 family)